MTYPSTVRDKEQKSYFRRLSKILQQLRAFKIKKGNSCAFSTMQIKKLRNNAASLCLDPLTRLLH